MRFGSLDFEWGKIETFSDSVSVVLAHVVLAES